MSDYRDSTPLVFIPTQREMKGDGEPLYPEKWPEFADKQGEQLPSSQILE